MLKKEKLHSGDFFRIVPDTRAQASKRTTRVFFFMRDRLKVSRHTPVMILQFLLLPRSQILLWLSAWGLANRDAACSAERSSLLPSMLRAPPAPAPDTRPSEEGNSGRDMTHLLPRSTASS